MKKLTYSILSMSIFQSLIGCFTGKSQKINTISSDNDKKASTFYSISIKSIDGRDINMIDFKGKKILIVNVASECGYTPQYKDLQKLYDLYKEKLVIIGCPCNQFGNQEPNTENEIKNFCEKNYGVTFLLTEKIDVKGENQHLLYQWLTQKSKNNSGDFEVKWNFNKFLINEEGRLIYYFGSGENPLDNKIINAIK